MNIPGHISETREIRNNFWVKNTYSLMLNFFDLGSGKEKFGSGIHPQHFFLLLLSLVRLLYRWNCFCFGCRRRRWASWLAGARSQTRRRRRERRRICSPPPRSFPAASSRSSTTSSSNCSGPLGSWLVGGKVGRSAADWSAAKCAARQLIGRRQLRTVTDCHLIGRQTANTHGSSCFLPDMSC